MQRHEKESRGAGPGSHRARHPVDFDAAQRGTCAASPIRPPRCAFVVSWAEVLGYLPVVTSEATEPNRATSLPATRRLPGRHVTAGDAHGRTDDNGQPGDVPDRPLRASGTGDDLSVGRVSASAAAHLSDWPQ